ncbi:Fe-S oxidoreductase [Leucobacter insecticola]|nr:Fe-S oxidoreductase [Leucobacter insecticola]
MGARWRVGESPHRAVPASLYETVREQEARFPEAHSWTLTWLEGRPRLALDDLVLVAVDGQGGVTVTEETAGNREVLNQEENDEDDDDWLN